MATKKITFVTGTRADFGKILPLIKSIENLPELDVEIFVTGMHMLARYGSTWQDVMRSTELRIHPFVNQGQDDSMDSILAKTISGIADYVKEFRPDLIVVHGDRIEALAGAAVGALNNVIVAHIEGGELSGTVDDSLRHSITKLSHVHFVSNGEAQARVIALGEDPANVFNIGSPDMDVIAKNSLPSVEEARKHYGISWMNFAILLFHPVTTEIEATLRDCEILMETLAKSGRKYLVIEPNNDSGADLIRSVYSRYQDHEDFLFFPSMRFEYFLSLLKSSDFIIGNSSAGVREAPALGIPAINIGSRQQRRVFSSMVLNAEISQEAIEESILALNSLQRRFEFNFGVGDSSKLFREQVTAESFWDISPQKFFFEYSIQGGKDE